MTVSPRPSAARKSAIVRCWRTEASRPKARAPSASLAGSALKAGGGTAKAGAAKEIKGRFSADSMKRAADKRGAGAGNAREDGADSTGFESSREADRACGQRPAPRIKVRIAKAWLIAL